MNERPPQPPEGKLLATALKASGLSIREASRRAGISYGRWRQITAGYQNVSPGSYAAVRAPAGTLARMAQIVGVTPGELESEGQRPDAAEELRADRRPVPEPRQPASQPLPPGTYAADDPDDEAALMFPGDSTARFIWRAAAVHGTGEQDDRARLAAREKQIELVCTLNQSRRGTSGEQGHREQAGLHSLPGRDLGNELATSRARRYPFRVLYGRNVVTRAR